MGSTARTATALFLMIAASFGAVHAASRGMIVDDETRMVTIFDTETDQIVGTLPLSGSGQAIGDCVVREGLDGFVTDFLSRLVVVDLTTTPPSPAPPPNPIPISNNGEDVALTADGRFVVTCDGAREQPVSVVDTATRSEVNTFPLTSGCNSVDVCDDGSVLVTTWFENSVRRLVLDSSGTLSDTGESLTFENPTNVYCTPGSQSGVVMSNLGAVTQSFTIPGLSAVDQELLNGTIGVSGVVNRGGDRFYLRSDHSVDVFRYGRGSASLTLLFTIPLIDEARTFFGVDQLALDPREEKLYVPQINAIYVYDATTGALLPFIIGSGIRTPTGICVPAPDRQDLLMVPIDIRPEDYPNSINPRSSGVIPVAILGSDTFDVTTIDSTTLRFGPGAALVAHDLNDSFIRSDHFQDVNQDGLMDLITHYRTWYSGIACGDESATLIGATTDRQAFEGMDSIRTVGCFSRRGMGRQRWRSAEEPE